VQAEKQPSPPERPRRRIAPIVGAVATGLSLIIGVIAIVPILTQNTSGVDKLAVTVEPYRPGDILLYAIPMDAIDELPPGEGDACSADRLAWLDANAAPVDGYYFVTITNKATSGNVIGFSNIVGVGESTAPAAGAVVIECDQNSANRIAPALVDASSGLPAYYDRSRMDDAGENPETPMIYNLAPGETGQFVLLVVSSEAFSGAIGYTVTSGSDRTMKTFDLGETVELPGTRPVRPTVVLAGDPFWACVTSQPIEECRS
jgi:hypothetical protein